MFDTWIKGHKKQQTLLLIWKQVSPSLTGVPFLFTKTQFKRDEAARFLSLPHTQYTLLSAYSPSANSQIKSFGKFKIQMSLCNIC